MASSIITEAFTYYLPEVPASEIDPNALEHSYYAQVAPDGRRLVPGLLQQGERPTIGNWMNVGYVDRDFPKRYFVQYTDFNTLVPGSLIQADRFPEGKWKEVKRRDLAQFNRVVFNNKLIINSGSLVTESTFIGAIIVVNDYILPVLDLLQPGVYSSSQPANLQFFYFAGDFQQLNNDVSILELMGEEDSDFSLYIDAQDLKTSLLISNQVTIYDDFTVKPSTPDGYHSLVVKVLPHGNTPAYYIVMENLIHKFDFPAA